MKSEKLRSKLEEYYIKREKQENNNGFIFTTWHHGENFLGGPMSGMACYGTYNNELEGGIIGCAVIQDSELIALDDNIIEDLKALRVEEAKIQILRAKAFKKNEKKHTD